MGIITSQITRSIVLNLSIFLLIFNLQAVVVSIDPRRVYVKDPNDVQLKTVRVSNLGEDLAAFFSFILYCIALNYLNAYSKFYVGHFFCGQICKRQI